MSQVQSGILPEHCRAAIWIEANLKGDVNALREASKIFVDNVATFQAKFPDAKLGAVVAFGNNVWRQLSGGEGAEELKDFPVYGKGLAPSTQYDLLIHILCLEITETILKIPDTGPTHLYQRIRLLLRFLSDISMSERSVLHFLSLNSPLNKE